MIIVKSEREIELMRRAKNYRGCPCVSRGNGKARRNNPRN